jgi:hypothetical protein
MHRSLTYKKASEIFRYDRETGKLFWNVARRGVTRGAEAGCKGRRDGYRRIGIGGVMYLAHRIIWLVETGQFPSKEIDHINGITDDNRFENLREVTHRENCQNRRKHREGRLFGTYFSKRFEKWHSRIQIEGKRKHLGLFETEQEAHEAYIKAFSELNKERPE